MSLVFNCRSNKIELVKKWPKFQGEGRSGDGNANAVVVVGLCRIQLPQKLTIGAIYLFCVRQKHLTRRRQCQSRSASLE